MIVPTKLVEVAMVAELLTCQKIWHGCAPPVSTTREPYAVPSVLPIWKMYPPEPLSVSVPFSDRALA